MKLMTVVGARPQFIKAFPVSRALAKTGIQEYLVDTGQHYDEAMAGAFFEEFDLPAPKHSLGVGSGSHGQMTGVMLSKLESVMTDDAPDAVMVYGDTNSTLAGALAAAKLSIPVVHIEAGLRSFRRSMPEEINRRVVDHLSSVLLCPTAHAVKQLKQENCVSPTVSNSVIGVEECRSMQPSDEPGIAQFAANIGDVMVDSLYAMQTRKTKFPVLEELNDQDFSLITIHRAESTDDHEILSGLFYAIKDLSQNMKILFPMHPRTKAAISRFGIEGIFESCPDIHITEPLPYEAMVQAQSKAKVIITDSGGVQKEAALLGTPCLTVRDETEWVETIETGWNKLLGLRPLSLVDDALNAKPPASGKPISVYGDGNAADRVACILKRFMDFI